MRTAFLILIFLVGFTPKAKSQLGVEIVELMVYYFMSWEEVSFQAEMKPSLNNTFFSYGFRGGHTNSTGNFTGGMSFYYSKDNYHSLIQQGSYTNYHIGAYLEHKFRSVPSQKVYLSLPLTLAVGESVSEGSIVPANYLQRSSFFYLEPELLLNYGIGDHFQVHCGPGYRYSSGSSTYGMTDESLSGLSFQFGIRFGSFYY